MEKTREKGMNDTPRATQGRASGRFGCLEISVLTEINADSTLDCMELTPVSQRFILHWGEMGSRWGVNRTVAQIHALLYITAKPLDAETIADTLGVARSNVSTSLKELQAWKLVRIVHIMGDRRDHFETSTDVWELFKLIVAGRRQREIDPTIAVLRECLSSPDLDREETGARARMQETLEFIEILTAWSDEMLRLQPETLMKMLGLGAKVSKVVRGTNG